MRDGRGRELGGRWGYPGTGKGYFGPKKSIFHVPTGNLNKILTDVTKGLWKGFKIKIRSKKGVSTFQGYRGECYLFQDLTRNSLYSEMWNHFKYGRSSWFEYDENNHKKFC